MKFGFLKMLLTTAFVLYSWEIFAIDPVEKLSQNLQKINTFKAHFVQKIRDANDEHYAQSEGEMMVQRPGKFYWKSQAPEPILVVGDGKYLWTYDIDLSQVTKQKQNEVLGNSPAALLAGSLSLLKDSFIVSEGKKNQCLKSDECYALQPKQKDAAFSDMTLGFTKGKLTEIRMHDSLGQNIYTVFSKVEINSPLEDSLFVFNPPKGVDIINSGK